MWRICTSFMQKIPNLRTWTFHKSLTPKVRESPFFSDNDSVRMDHWGNQEDIKSIANDAIHSMDEDVQDILEQDDGMQMSSFAKLCREYVRAA